MLLLRFLHQKRSGSPPTSPSAAPGTFHCRRATPKAAVMRPRDVRDGHRGGCGRILPLCPRAPSAPRAPIHAPREELDAGAASRTCASSVPASRARRIRTRRADTSPVCGRTRRRGARAWLGAHVAPALLWTRQQLGGHVASCAPATFALNTVDALLFGQSRRGKRARAFVPQQLLRGLERKPQCARHSRSYRSSSSRLTRSRSATDHPSPRARLFSSASAASSDAFAPPNVSPRLANAVFLLVVHSWTSRCRSLRTPAVGVAPVAPPPLSPSRYATRSAESKRDPGLGVAEDLARGLVHGRLGDGAEQSARDVVRAREADVRAAAHSGTRLPLVPLREERNLLLGVGVLLALGLVALLPRRRRLGARGRHHRERESDKWRALFFGA